MGDIEAKEELRGVSGWLVLFQIFIILAVCVSFNNILLVLFAGKTVHCGMFLPYYVLFNVFMLLISLVCMILFYKKQIAFRRIFIFHGIVYAIYLVLYDLYGTAPVYFSHSAASYHEYIYKAAMVIKLIIIIGIYITFFISLYSSKRVENTFR